MKNVWLERVSVVQLKGNMMSVGRRRERGKKI
jgi:hypothetical protein